MDSWHDAVFQCVAENDQGMIVSSVWVDVEGRFNTLLLSAFMLQPWDTRSCTRPHQSSMHHLTDKDFSNALFSVMNYVGTSSNNNKIYSFFSN